MRTFDIFMRSTPVPTGWEVTLWKCRGGWRPDSEARRITGRLSSEACWDLFDDLTARWTPRGITLRWATKDEAKFRRAGRWWNDLERLQDETVKDELAAEAAAVAHG